MVTVVLNRVTATRELRSNQQKNFDRSRTSAGFREKTTKIELFSKETIHEDIRKNFLWENVYTKDKS